MSNDANTGKVSTEEIQQMATYLENILTRQLERLKKYDLDGAIELAQQADDIAARLGSPVDETSARLEDLAERGLLFRLVKGDTAKYGAIPFVHGLLETTHP